MNSLQMNTQTEQIYSHRKCSQNKPETSENKQIKK